MESKWGCVATCLIDAVVILVLCSSRFRCFKIESTDFPPARRSLSNRNINVCSGCIDCFTVWCNVSVIYKRLNYTCYGDVTCLSWFCEPSHFDSLCSDSYSPVGGESICPFCPLTRHQTSTFRLTECPLSPSVLRSECDRVTEKM